MTDLNDEESRKYLEGLTDRAKEEFIIKKIKESKDIPENAKSDMLSIMRAMKILDDY